MKEKAETVAFIIPCKNEQAALPALLSELKLFKDNNKNQNMKVYLVDDFSDTPLKLYFSDLGNKNAAHLGDLQISLVENSLAPGKTWAQLSGLLEAKKDLPDIMVFMDGDGQHNILDISGPLQQIKEAGGYFVAKRSNLRRSGLSRFLSPLYEKIKSSEGGRDYQHEGSEFIVAKGDMSESLEQTLGPFPLIDAFKISLIKPKFFESQIRDPFGRKKTSTRFSLSKLLDKAISSLLSNPDSVSVISVKFSLILSFLVALYGSVVAAHAFISGQQNGTASIIILGLLGFLVGLYFATLILLVSLKTLSLKVREIQRRIL